MYELQQYGPGGGGYVPQQLMPQSLFGGLLGRRFGNTNYGCGPSGSLGGPRPLLPFDVDPVALANLQQSQLAQCQQLQQQIQQLQQQLQQQQSQQAQPQQFAPQGANPAGLYGQSLSPFDIDPVAAAYAYQQAQAMQGML